MLEIHGRFDFTAAELYVRGRTCGHDLGTKSPIQLAMQTTSIIRAVAPTTPRAGGLIDRLELAHEALTTLFSKEANLWARTKGGSFQANQLFQRRRCF